MLETAALFHHTFAEEWMLYTSLTSKTLSSDSGGVVLVFPSWPSLAAEHEFEGPHAAPHLVDHFLLHQVEAHGYERHAQHQIHGAEDEAELNLLALDHSFARNDVSEPNRAEADEAEIRTVQEVPAFPFGEQDSAETDVPAAEINTGNTNCNYNVWRVCSVFTSL
jgi:hypothetical protein